MQRMVTLIRFLSIDNTNADIDTRAEWIKLSRRLEIPIRCILFTASARLCEHNDVVRALNGTLVRLQLIIGR